MLRKRAMASLNSTEKIDRFSWIRFSFVKEKSSMRKTRKLTETRQLTNKPVELVSVILFLIVIVIFEFAYFFQYLPTVVVLFQLPEPIVERFVRLFDTFSKFVLVGAVSFESRLIYVQYQKVPVVDRRSFRFVSLVFYVFRQDFSLRLANFHRLIEFV